jgi:segregation and condensation protein A
LIVVNGKEFTPPQDLFIPPDALQVILEQFEGPLDLLLYLIRKHNINLLEVNLSDLTDQYMEYVNKIHNFDTIADYMVMASWLIEAKSKLLIPLDTNDDNLEEVDPRIELLRRLQAYEQIKYGADILASKMVHYQKSYPIMAIDGTNPNKSYKNPTLEELADIFQKLNDKKDNQQKLPELLINQNQTNIQSKIGIIWHKLPYQVWSSFNTLFNKNDTRGDIVLCFVIVLELIRLQKVLFSYQTASDILFLQRINDEMPTIAY